MPPRNPQPPLYRLRWPGALLLLGLASPGLAANHEADGIIVGQTRCEDAIRAVYARDREHLRKVDDVPHEDTPEMRRLRSRLKKPKGDGTHYKDLYLEASRLDEQADLAAVAKGPDVRGLNTEECNPFGYMATHDMASRALKLDAPVQVDVAALGEKKCPYGSNFISVAVSAHPNGRLLCLDGVAAVYSKLVLVEQPKLKQELAGTEGATQELGIMGLTIDTDSMTAARFQSGVAFRREEGLLVLTGFGRPPDGPVKVTRKRNDFLYKMPTGLVFEPVSEVLYMSKAAVDTLEQDKKLYDALAARAAARKKKRR